MTSKTLTQDSDSFFWPFVLSLLLVHVPLVFLFVFMENQPSPYLQNASLQTSNRPLMVDLKALPVVDVATPDFEEIPDQPHALSQYNVKVKEETVNANRSNSTTSSGTPAQTEKSNTQTEQILPQKPDSNSQSLSEALSKLDEQQKISEQKFDNAFKSKTPMPPPSFTKGNFGSGSYEPYYKLGDKTFINALANPHIWYYIQIRRKYEIAWNPIPMLRQNRSQLNGNQISCVWGMSISPSGEISDLQIIRSSGLAAYDAEAKRTIAVSAPFGAPPAELLAGRKTLDVAWEFVVYFR